MFRARFALLKLSGKSSDTKSEIFILFIYLQTVTYDIHNKFHNARQDRQADVLHFCMSAMNLH